MNWTELLTSRTVKSHSTSPREIDDLRNLVKRDLADISIVGLSDDRRFATAYNAVLQLSKIAIACAGYRVSSGAGHHQKTFEAVKIALGSHEAEALADYFDTCRRKRNAIDYDGSEIVSNSEADELIANAVQFLDMIEDWIKREHPSFRS